VAGDIALAAMGGDRWETPAGQEAPSKAAARSARTHPRILARASDLTFVGASAPRPSSCSPAPPTPSTMASLSASPLLPQCSSCVRRVARRTLGAGAHQQTRPISKAAKEAERNIVVKLLKDVPKFGRAGATAINPSWRSADVCQAPMSPSTRPRCATAGSPPASPTTFPLHS
jgi:hypothetical protein